MGFASLSSHKPKLRSTVISRPKRILERDDEDDPYGSEESEEENGDFEDDVDLDVLPTLLVYLGGELVHNWVRVDWEAGRQGVEELLRKCVQQRKNFNLSLIYVIFRHHIIQDSRIGDGNCGLPSDDENELFDSDDNT